LGGIAADGIEDKLEPVSVVLAFDGKGLGLPGNFAAGVPDVRRENAFVTDREVDFEVVSAVPDEPEVGED
jgi:hypothetical protein